MILGRKIGCGWRGACLWLSVQVAIAFGFAAPQAQARPLVPRWQQATAPQQILALAKNNNKEKDDNQCGHHPGCEEDR